MPPVAVIETIRAPIEKVFDFIAHVETHPQIADFCREVKIVSEQKAGKGTRFRQVYANGDEHDSEVVVWVSTWAMKSKTFSIGAQFFHDPLRAHRNGDEVGLHPVRRIAGVGFSRLAGREVRSAGQAGRLLHRRRRLLVPHAGAGNSGSLRYSIREVPHLPPLVRWFPIIGTHVNIVLLVHRVVVVDYRHGSPGKWERWV